MDQPQAANPNELAACLLHNHLLKYPARELKQWLRALPPLCRPGSFHQAPDARKLQSIPKQGSLLGSDSNLLQVMAIQE